MTPTAEPPVGSTVTELAPLGHTWQHHPDGWRCGCTPHIVWTWDELLDDIAGVPYRITKPTETGRETL